MELTSALVPALSEVCQVYNSGLRSTVQFLTAWFCKEHQPLDDAPLFPETPVALGFPEINVFVHMRMDLKSLKNTRDTKHA